MLADEDYVLNRAEYKVVREREREVMRTSFLDLIVVCFALLLAASSLNQMARGSQSDQDPQQHVEQEEEVEIEVGGIREVQGFENDVEYEQLARFAVDEHNKNQNAALEFVRLVNVKEQVVSGIMNYLTVEVNEAGKKKLYEAKLWVQVWLNSQKLLEFKPLGDSSSSIVTSAGLGANRGD